MIYDIIRIIRNPDSPLWGPPEVYGEWAYPVHCVIEFLGSNWFLFPVVGVLTYLVYRKHPRREQLQALVVSYYFLVVVIITDLIISTSYFPDFHIFDTEIYTDMTRINIGTHMSQLNLKPFYSIAGTFQRSILYGMKQTFGNIILFIPCGVFIQQFSRKKKVFRSVIYCFLISLLIETCQLFLTSSVDVDDLIMNTLGGAIGAFALQLPVIRQWIVRIQHLVEEKTGCLN